MGATQIYGRQVQDGSIGRPDLNVSTSGQAVITRILEVASAGIKINGSSGADSGTGDVSLTCDFTYLDTQYARKTAINAQKIWGRYAVTSGVLQEIGIGSGLILPSATGILALNLDKSLVEAVLVGDITTHTHSIYQTVGTGGSDFNTQITDGRYRMAYQATNRPDTGNYHILDVEHVGSVNYIRQITTSINNRNQFVRTSLDKGVTWGSWVAFYNAENSNLSTVNWAANNITAAGTVTATGGNSTNWNTAYTHSQSAHAYLPLAGGTMSNTNLVANLNAERLNGQTAGYYATATHTHSGVYEPAFATLPVSKGGTGLGTMGTAQQVIRVNAAGTALEYGDSATYSLPTATSTVLGGVKIGQNITITDGVISFSPTYWSTGAFGYLPLIGGGGNICWSSWFHYDDSSWYGLRVPKIHVTNYTGSGEVNPVLLDVDGIANFNGSLAAPVYRVKNSSGAEKFNVSVDSSDRLQVKNAVGTVVCTVDQSGNITTSGTITAMNFILS